MRVRILGLKLSRWRQWVHVLKLESKGKTFRDKVNIAIGMIVAATEGFATPSEWRSRVSTCHKCPIFDKFNYRCRPVDENGDVASTVLGCGCAMTIKSLFRKATCWGDDNLPDFPHGWASSKGSTKAERHPNRLEA